MKGRGPGRHTKRSNKPVRRTGRPNRPAPKFGPGMRVNDRTVDECYAVVRHAESQGHLPDLQGRRGPRGLSVKTLLLLMLVAALDRSSTELATVWECAFFGLTPPQKRLHDIPTVSLETPLDERSSSGRIYRASNKLFDHFDPLVQAGRRDEGYDRRKCHDVADAERWSEEWADHQDLLIQLEALCQSLIEAPVLFLLRRSGRVGSWKGAVGVDATSVAVQPKQPFPDSPKACAELLAGLYVSGGGNPKYTWGYSFSAVFTAAPGQAPGSFPQVCLGGVLQIPSRDIGGCATRTFQRMDATGFHGSLLAADRAYTNSKPESFQTPARELGYSLRLDYRIDQLGRQGESRGAPWIDGSLFCPGTPERMINAGVELRKARDAGDKDKKAIAIKLLDNRHAFALHRKEEPDANGTERFACPGKGKCPTVVCPRLSNSGGQGPRQVSLSSAPGGRGKLLPLVRIDSTPDNEVPDVCRHGSVSIPADANAKYRQDVLWMSAQWRIDYSVIRSLNEGGNSVLKRVAAGKLDEPQLRLARGFAAQSILVAILICAANILEIKRFLRENPESATEWLDNEFQEPIEGETADVESDRISSQHDPPS